jgi:GT2 family glycosyltransferase
MNPLLTIAIPTWNNLQQLQWCIDSLFRFTEYPFKVVIVDNGGQREVENWLSVDSRAITVINAEHNLGWMKAINLVLEDCDTDYFCMLNDDVVFTPNQPQFWRTLLSNFSDSSVGAVNPCSNFVAGPQSLLQIDTSLIFNSSILIGFCLAIKTETLKLLGGLDETLPGGDDLDLSIRLMSAGFDLRVDKGCYLHHFGQQTGNRVHAGFWDSSWHQELVNNAIIKKHGLLKWLECFKAGWTNTKAGIAIEDDVEHLWVEAQIERNKGKDILDVGAGSRKIDGVVSVDIIDGVGVAGGQKGKETKPDIVADAADIPLENESQDLIIATHILEHTIDPLRTLKEWLRLLRPEGRIILSVPNNERLPTMLIDYTHVHAYNEDSLKNIMEVSGFFIDSIKTDLFGAIRVEARRT